MFTPEEALAELDHAVGELGLKAVMMSGIIPRSLPGAEGHRAARYMNGVGHDSEHDYDPVWRRCIELGVCPTFHASGQGWGSRASRTNYVHNHIGNFAAAGEAAARSLLLGGAPMRFPNSPGHFSRVASHGGPISSATRSATSKSATGRRSITTTLPRSIEAESPNSSGATELRRFEIASTASTMRS